MTQLGPQNTARALPFFVAVDAKLRVVDVGPSAAKIGFVAGRGLTEQASLLRPATALTLDALWAARDQQIQLEGPNAVRLRAQVLRSETDPDRLILVMSPWVRTLGQIEATGLMLSDFPLHDSVGDYVMLLSGRERDLAEQTELAQSLLSERRQLRRAHRRLAALNALGILLDRLEVPGVEAWGQVFDTLCEELNAEAGLLFQGEVCRARDGATGDALAAMVRDASTPTVAEVAGRLLLLIPVRDVRLGLVLSAGADHEAMEAFVGEVRLRLLTWARSRALEARIREDEAKFRMLFDETSDRLFLADADGTITLANAAWGDVEGRLLTEVVVPEDRSVLDGLLDEARAGGRARATIRLLGGDRHYDLQLGRAGSAVVGSLYDVTERVLEEAALRRAESEAKAASEAKGAFIRMVSHEMRTPLNAVLGMTELARSAPDDQRVYYLERISAASERLRRLVEGTLDVSKIQAGELVLLPEDVRLVDVVQARLAAVPEVSFSSDGLVPVQADPARVGQLVDELVRNARQFGGDGPVDVAMTGTVDGDHLVVRLVVQDRGPGLDAVQIPQAFEPFVRLDATVSEGVGLGLTIARAISRAMGGDLRLEVTDPGLRAVAEWRVPRVREPVRLLAVGPTETSWETLLGALDGVQITAVDGAPDALRAARERRYPVVVISAELAGVSPPALAEVLERIQPGAAITQVGGRSDVLPVVAAEPGVLSSRIANLLSDRGIR